MEYKFKSHKISVKNSESEDKPNEDYFIADDSNGIYIVADGVTATPRSGDKYPNPAGGQLAARMFCEEVYKHLLFNKKAIETKSVEIVKQAISLANLKICSLNQAHNRYKEANFADKDYFGTVGTVVVATNERFSILHVGDVMALLKRKLNIDLLTNIQTRNVFEYKKKVTETGIINPRDLAITVRRDFRNNINSQGLNGEKVGYGVFTGEEGVRNFVQVCEVPFHENDTLLILSDGLEPLIDYVLHNPEGMLLFCRMIDEGPEFLNWLLAENQQFEKRSDDKTALVINV